MRTDNPNSEYVSTPVDIEYGTTDSTEPKGNSKISCPSDPVRLRLEIRLTICLNQCPIGPRIQRGEPLPKYQHTYNNTPEGLLEAKKDMSEIQAYIARNQKIIKRK